jgi:hypothetical protein
MDSTVSDMVVGDGSGLPRALRASRGEHPSVLQGGRGLIACEWWEWRTQHHSVGSFACCSVMYTLCPGGKRSVNSEVCCWGRGGRQDSSQS